MKDIKFESLEVKSSTDLYKALDTYIDELHKVLTDILNTSIVVAIYTIQEDNIGNLRLYGARVGDLVLEKYKRVSSKEEVDLYIYSKLKSYNDNYYYIFGNSWEGDKVKVTNIDVARTRKDYIKVWRADNLHLINYIKYSPAIFTLTAMILLLQYISNITLVEYLSILLFSLLLAGIPALIGLAVCYIKFISKEHRNNKALY